MSSPLSLALAWPLALDGESITGNSTGIAVIALLSMIGGWVLLACLWWFVFREKSRVQRRERGESVEDREGRGPGRRG